MTQSIALLFPTPLVHTNIGTDYIIDKDIKFREGKLNNGYISIDEKYLDSNKKLKDRIDNEIEVYLRESLKLKKTVYLKHQTSWILLHMRDHFTSNHYHMNSWLSGIYYYKAPKNPGAVKFNTERPYGWTCSSMNPESELLEKNNINTNSFVFDPIDGDLLLFPSQLNHQALPNMTDDDRIAISFNYTLHGTWGDSTYRITM